MGFSLVVVFGEIADDFDGLTSQGRVAIDVHWPSVCAEILGGKVRDLKAMFGLRPTPVAGGQVLEIAETASNVLREPAPPNAAGAISSRGAGSAAVSADASPP